MRKSVRPRQFSVNITDIIWSIPDVVKRLEQPQIQCGSQPSNNTMLDFLSCDLDPGLQSCYSRDYLLYYSRTRHVSPDCLFMTWPTSLLSTARTVFWSLRNTLTKGRPSSVASRWWTDDLLVSLSTDSLRRAEVSPRIEERIGAKSHYCYH